MSSSRTEPRTLPLMLFADDRARYLEALRIADQGDPAPFVRFVANRVSTR